MKKSITNVKVAAKKRFSASMEGFLIDFVNGEAVKEDRSFSDMIGRLVNEARQYRLGLVTGSKLKSYNTKKHEK